MRFLVDQQLPPSLSRWLADAGHDSVHVSMIGLDAADDAAVWSWAQRENRVVVSKDEDFLFLANRPKDTGRLLWVRLRNCRREALLAAFGQALDSALAAFAEGQRVVEIG